MFEKEDIYFPIKQKPACQLKWNWSTVWLTYGATNSCHRCLPIDLDKDNLLIISAGGDVFKFPKVSRKLIPLVSNLKKRVDDQEPHLVNPYSGGDISERLTVRDVAYNKNSKTIYVSYFKYSKNHELPIHFIVEDNKMSVCTNTREVWNQKKLSYEGISDEYVTYYHYKLKYPHAGAGKRVQF